MSRATDCLGQDSGWLQIEVTDNGHRSRCNPFASIRSVFSRPKLAEAGIGVELAVSRRIVEADCGSLGLARSNGGGLLRHSTADGATSVETDVAPETEHKPVPLVTPLPDPRQPACLGKALPRRGSGT